MNVISPKDSAIQKLLPILIILLVAAAFAPLLNRTLTYDEAFTYNQYASQGIGRTLIAYTTPNNHVLHTAMVWLTTSTMGRSEIAIRLPAFFFGLLAIAMSYRLARRYTKSFGLGLVAMALLAAQAGFVLYSVSARGYTLTMLLTLVELYLLNSQNLPARVRNYGLMFASMGLIMTLPTMIIAIAALFLLSDAKPPIVVGAIMGAMFYVPAIAIGVFSEQAALHGATFEGLTKEFDRLFISAATIIVVAGLILIIIKRPIVQKDTVKFVGYAAGLALIVVAGQLIITGKTWYARNLLFLLPCLTLLAVLGLRHLPTRYGAWLTLPLIVAFIWLGADFDTFNEADAAIDYLEAQPMNNTVVFGCCVNEVVTYYHGEDDRLQLRLDMEQVVVVFNPNDDNVNKVLRDYEVDDLIKDCEYSERYRNLVIYECEFEPPPED